MNNNTLGIYMLAIIKYKTLTLTSLLLLTLLSTQAFSQQLLFNKTRVGSSTKFDYKWEDAKSNLHEFNFQLTTKNISSDFRHFKALTPSRLQNYSIKKLKQAVAKLDPRKGSVKIKPTYNGVGFEFKSTSNQWMNEQSTKLKNVYDASLDEYLYDEYYIEFQPIGYKSNTSNKTYKPDHVRFATESSPSLSSIIDKLKEKFPNASPRVVAEFLLSWIQTIPYNTLESRTQSNGAGFSPPLKVIAENKGDCDSKVTLMASILKAMFPRLKLAIIYVPEHALIGLNVSYLSSDYKVKIDELDYTLAEPTGPRLIKFADISERSKRFIESGMYQIENF
jgi:hypothetical protein